MGFCSSSLGVPCQCLLALHICHRYGRSSSMRLAVDDRRTMPHSGLCRNGWRWEFAPPAGVSARTVDLRHNHCRRRQSVQAIGTETLALSGSRPQQVRHRWHTDPPVDPNDAYPLPARHRNDYQAHRTDPNRLARAHSLREAWRFSFLYSADRDLRKIVRPPILCQPIPLNRFSQIR